MIFQGELQNYAERSAGPRAQPVLSTALTQGYLFERPHSLHHTQNQAVYQFLDKASRVNESLAFLFKRRCSIWDASYLLLLSAERSRTHEGGFDGFLFGVPNPHSIRSCWSPPAQGRKGLLVDAVAESDYCIVLGSLLPICASK